MRAMSTSAWTPSSKKRAKVVIGWALWCDVGPLASTCKPRSTGVWPQRKAGKATALQSGDRLLLVAALDDPAVDIAKHVGVEAMVGWIGVHLDRHAGAVEQTEIVPRERERQERVGDAVPDEHA